LEGVLARWQQGLATAFMEGLNSLFPATKCKAGGCRSVEHQTAMPCFAADKNRQLEIYSRGRPGTCRRQLA